MGWGSPLPGSICADQWSIFRKVFWRAHWEEPQLHQRPRPRKSQRTAGDELWRNASKVGWYKLRKLQTKRIIFANLHHPFVGVQHFKEISLGYYPYWPTALVKVVTLPRCLLSEDMLALPFFPCSRKTRPVWCRALSMAKSVHVILCYQKKICIFGWLDMKCITPSSSYLQTGPGQSPSNFWRHVGWTWTIFLFVHSAPAKETHRSLKTDGSWTNKNPTKKSMIFSLWIMNLRSRIFCGKKNTRKLPRKNHEFVTKKRG